jgi:hypothetical protein
MLGHKSAKVQLFGICSLAKQTTQGRLTGTNRSNYKTDLRKHGLAGCIPHLNSVTSPVNFSHFSKAFVKFNHRFWLLVVSLEPFCDNFFCVIRTATGLCSFHATSHTDFLRCIEVEHCLSFANYLFKVDCLIYGSGEPINKIVLKFG